CATVQAVLAVGATPRFVDIDPATLCVDHHLVMEAVTPRTAAVIPVLFGGRPVDLAPIHGELAQRGIAIIEDAAHAFGSRNGTRRVGASGATMTLEGVTLVDVDVHHAVPHLCQVRVAQRDRVFAELRARGIGVGVHYPPNHLQPAFVTWRRPLPTTEQIGKEVLSLPFHQHLTETDIDHVVSALEQALKSAGAA
ncbi:DegT/DnrJ/EryC1/StrS family aminotransferase, partial [Streptomyces sp. MCAF7]